MATGTINITKTLDNIKAIAVTITGIGATRAKQGKLRLGETDNLESTVEALTAETQGYFVFWLADRGVDIVDQTGTVKILAELLVKMPKDTTTDTNSAIELAESLLTALLRESNYNTAGLLKPTSGGYTDDGGKDTEDGGICYFTFSLEFQTGMTCGN